MTEKKNVFTWFFVDAFWLTFCKKWIWKGFFVDLVYKKFDKWKGWLYLSPALVLLGIFTVWPIFNTVSLAFLEGYKTGSTVGYSIGFDNFIKVFQFKDFLVCLKNTIVLCVITVPISTFLALVIAVCLNSIKWFNKALQTIYFLPYVTNSIAIGMVFASLFSVINPSPDFTSADSFGIINNVIEFFGGEPQNWINPGAIGRDTFIGRPHIVMAIYIIWNALPFKILILLGGLQSVNKQYYDAAKIDATSRVRTFFKITVPLLSPMIAYVLITGFIGGFKEYSSIVGVIGEPSAVLNGRMNTMVGYIYAQLGAAPNFGRASAAALILFAIIFMVTMVNLYVSKKKTQY